MFQVYNVNTPHQADYKDDDDDDDDDDDNNNNKCEIRDRLCGLVVRVSGYRYRVLGFDSRHYQIF